MPARPGLQISGTILLAASWVLMCTVNWAYEVLRPLRDAADPNEHVWLIGSIAAATASVTFYLASGERRGWHRIAPWLAIVPIGFAIFVFTMEAMIPATT